jgi:hypothetical protein
LAQPNQIVVSAATRAMLGDHFDLEDLGAYELKGFADPVPVWRVLSARDVESRFAATRTRRPLVGRQAEMGLLLRAWEGSSRGRGQVVLIQGEAGVGKSRLVEGLREASGKDHIWVAIRCSPPSAFQDAEANGCFPLFRVFWARPWKASFGSTAEVLQLPGSVSFTPKQPDGLPAQPIFSSVP